MKPNLLYTLALTYIPGVGAVNANKILQAIDSPELIWQMSEKELNQIFKNKKEFIPPILNHSTLQLAQKEIEFAEKNEIQILTQDSEDYPSKLKDLVDAPVVLFQKGKHNFNQNLHIAIVGTRKMTWYGKQFIHQLLDEIQNQSIQIVSGLAFGCDIEAHRKSLDLGIPNVAVLAQGLNKISPKTHIQDAQRIVENGCLLTEYSTFHQAEPMNFILRNRIIAGISDAVIVVESDKKGGSLATAMYANGYNREVFALPGRIDDKFSLGCNELIQTNQASMIRNARDLMQYFNLKSKPKTIQKSLFIHLESDEQEIYDFLKSNGKQQIDQLANALNKPTYQLNTTLLNLELKGIIKALSGKIFEIN